MTVEPAEPVGRDAAPGPAHWRPSRWRLSSRIVAMSLGLLLVVQLAGFGVLRTGIERNARAMLASELAVGERVGQRVLEQRANKLSQGAALLAADFGFRDAVATGDVETVASALANQGERIGATVTALLDTARQVKALGDGMDHADALRRWLDSGRLGKEGQAIVMLGGVPYQFVVVPMKAPVLVGWVVMGFPIDAGVVADLRALSGLQVALVARGAAPGPVGSLPSTIADLEAGTSWAAGSPFEVDVRGDVHLALASALHAAPADGGPVLHAVFLRSIDEAVAPYRRLQAMLAIITALGVVLFAAGSVWTARRVTTPLRKLVRASERLGAGDYETPLADIGRHDEVGELAKAYDRMRISIAAQQAEIRKLAYWDRLTGLPNRVRFREAVQRAMTEREAGGGVVSVVMLDLDRFKHVNDVLGYAFGDRLLTGVAERLAGLTGSAGAMAARLGGDEFALLLPDSDGEAARGMAVRIARAFEEPLALDDQRVDLSAGIGIAAWPQHAGDVDTLLSRAEVAMYAAKRKTTGLQVYDPALDSGSSQTLSLLSQLRQAVEHGELRLFLQPKLALGDARVVGAEALVRWQHPVRGLVPPMEFIPFAEQTGFVRQLTLWMFEEAARQWRAMDHDDVPLRVAVNLSTRDLLDLELPAKLDLLLARHDVPAQAFCLEITESAIMDDPQRAQATLARLHERGFKLSIDDYGTGYTSLGYLRHLPVDELKIDKSFVMGMERDASDLTIVRSTIDLAHNLGLRVVAEGVENQAIWQRLQALGCDEAQGYHMSKPLPADQFGAWVRGWRELHPRRQNAREPEPTVPG